MILQALVEHYEDLADAGKIGRPGWSEVKVSYALDIDDSGTVMNVIPMLTEQQVGKKTKLLPQTIMLPLPVKRTVGISANFLCDNSSYILGANLKADKERANGNMEKAKAEEERAKQCFEACRAHHENILSGVNSKHTTALLNYFRSWEPDKLSSVPVVAALREELLSGGNIIFRHNGEFIHKDAEITAAWQRYYNASSDAENMICLVTGEAAPPAILHPSIKGIAGAQSSGASLVSFNSWAVCSYGKTPLKGEQGKNAPTSEYAAFAYGTALNALIADREHTWRIGDTTVMCWAKGGEPVYQGLFGGLLCGDDSYSESDLQNVLKKVANGEPVDFDETRVDPERPFYVLGISPNAARLSIRFFHAGTFGSMVKNIALHYERLEIVRPATDRFGTVPLWRLLNATVNQNSRDKSASPVTAGETLRAILENGRYPASLMNGVILRIRAEHEVTRERAAIIKAYYLRNTNQNGEPYIAKEALTVALNPECTSTAYNLGRLFSVLEEIQNKANPGINTTIKDKYFNSASSTPAAIFPLLINLAQKHMRKMENGSAVYCSRMLGEIMDRFDEPFPARMSLPQQGEFQLGYYHQTQYRYTKKEDK